MNENCAQKYASSQGAAYDKNTGMIQYGINKNMKALGVYNGKGCADLTYPSMYPGKQKNALGLAGGNPYKQNAVKNNNIFSMEHFSTNNNNNNYFNFYLFIVVILLIVLMKC